MPRKNMDGSRGCFTPAVACIVLFLLLCLGRAWSEERPLPDKVSLDFVDASLQDVARSVSLAYGVPVLVDAGAEARVTFHLDGVGLLEGLTSLCSTLGLELIRDGTVFHIRKRLEHGENFFRVTDSLVSLDVRERDVRVIRWRCSRSSWSASSQPLSLFSSSTGSSAGWAGSRRVISHFSLTSERMYRQRSND